MDPHSLCRRKTGNSDSDSGNNTKGGQSIIKYKVYNIQNKHSMGEMVIRDDSYMM